LLSPLLLSYQKQKFPVVSSEPKGFISCNAVKKNLLTYITYVGIRTHPTTHLMRCPLRDGIVFRSHEMSQ